jgi:hypothetical protein
MAENKTKPTDASVEDYIASRANEQQRSDCLELMALLKKVTQQPPKMWGAQHRRLWLLPIHLRERAHRGGSSGGLRHPWYSRSALSEG